MPHPLEVVGLAKAYARRSVLAGLDLRVEAGEALALCGPNGAGKSTLVGCVCGTVVADAGSIRIDGHDLVGAPIAARQRLRYLAQEIDVPAGVTGRELLAFHAEVFAEPEALDEALALADLGEAIDHLATTYSVGMRRRLAVACLSPGRAALYVLDEPFAGLDGDSRVRVSEWLARQVARGAGVLFAAHDQDAPLQGALGARVLRLG